MNIEDIFKQIPEAQTPAQMREAIRQVQRDNPIVHQALRWAAQDGLNAEDTYTLVAYYAIKGMIAAQRAHYNAVALSPSPIIVVPAP